MTGPAIRRFLQFADEAVERQGHESRCPRGKARGRVKRHVEGANLFGCSCITQGSVLLRSLGRQMWRGRVLRGISCCDG